MLSLSSDMLVGRESHSVLAVSTDKMPLKPEPTTVIQPDPYSDEFDIRRAIRKPKWRPIGNLIVRMEGREQIEVPFCEYETAADIRKKIGNVCRRDWHLCTKHGVLAEGTPLKDYRLVDQSILLVLPKNKEERARVKRRDAWLAKMGPREKELYEPRQAPKVVRPRPPKKPPFYCM